MNLAILHYHLQSGGVTQVIVNHLWSLNAVGGSSNLRIAVLHGGRADGWPADLAEQLPGIEVSLHAIQGLGYDTGAPAAAQLAGAISRTLKGCGFAADETVIHVHNHALGKNVSLPGALHELAGDGFAQLLQTHDFAEDFRPVNYQRLSSALAPDQPEALPAILYPQANAIHYAVLNGRDQSVLRRAGVVQDHLHLLPNPISAPGQLPARQQARDRLREMLSVPTGQRYFLYPVRCIRRKNIGETLLWSLLSEGRATIGLTLAPTNPVELPSYERWKRLSAELQLDCRFEAGGPDGLGFLENLAAADAMLTTSVAEGFGMVFLETWLVGRPLVGRDLPEITSDFVTAGICLNQLAPRLWVPLQMVGEAAFRAQLMDAYRRVCTDFGQSFPGSAVLAGLVDRIIPEGKVDFAMLASSQQAEVVRLAHGQAEHRETIRQLNPRIADSFALESEAMAGTIAENAAAVGQHFSAASCGRHLMDIYERVVSSQRSDTLQPLSEGSAVLDSFLDITRLNPIRL